MADDRVLTHAEISNRAERAVLRSWRALADLRQVMEGDDALSMTLRVNLIGSGLLQGLRDEVDEWLALPVSERDLDEHHASVIRDRP